MRGEIRTKIPAFLNFMKVEQAYLMVMCVEVRGLTDKGEALWINVEPRVPKDDVSRRLSRVLRRLISSSGKLFNSIPHE